MNYYPPCFETGRIIVHDPVLIIPKLLVSEMLPEQGTK
jgi:hypothetical protein